MLNKQTSPNDGNEWQATIKLLLILKYKENFVCIPDKTQGDCGLEGFTFDGMAFQCYAPEEPLTTKARYEKQRTKITTDVRKLKEKKDEISEIIGTTKLRRWVLVTPFIDNKDLIKHATKKASEVKDWGLPYIHNDFQILIWTADEFIAEKAALVEAAVLKINGSVEKATQQDKLDWVRRNTESVGSLDKKLEKVFPKSKKKKSF
jgi:hypothetical protein